MNFKEAKQQVTHMEPSHLLVYSQFHTRSPDPLKPLYTKSRFYASIIQVGG